MSKVRNLFWVLWLGGWVLSMSAVGYGQSRSTLEQRRKRLQRKIKATQRLLNKTTRAYRQTAAYLQLLDRQIQDRQRLIHTLTDEIYALNRQIEAKQKVIDALEQDLRSLKSEYKRLLIAVYRIKRQYLPVTFILDAPRLDGTVKKVRLLRFYEEHRRQQIRLIQQTQAVLKRETEALKAQHQERQQLLRRIRREEAQLQQRQKERQVLVQQLRRKKQTLLRQLAEQRQEARRLDEAIRAAIRKEMAARKRRPLKGKEKALAAAFAQKRGRLPWPVKRGVLLRSFGMHPHPVIKNVKVQNNGIDIRTYLDEPVRAVADGVVSRIVILPTGSRAVLVRHGGYYTVYSNLRKTTVKTGQSVYAGDVMGYVRNGRHSQVPELHFEVWKGVQRQNPTRWLRRR